MNKLLLVPRDVEEDFSRALGYVIWTMGQIEYLSIEWAHRLGGHEAKDHAIRQRGFGGRYKVVLSCIDRSVLDCKLNKEYRTLWRRAKAFSTFRNLIAHNPVVGCKSDSSIQYAVIDARKLQGASKRHVKTWPASKLNKVSLRMRELALSLDSKLHLLG